MRASRSRALTPSEGPEVATGGRWLVWLALIVVGGAGGYALGRGAGPSSKAQTRDDPRPEVQEIQKKLDALAAGQSAVEAQLAAMRGRTGDVIGIAPPPSAQPALAGTPTSPSPMEATLAPRDVEIAAAEERGHTILADAVHAGRWTSSDRDQMRDALATTDDDGRRALLRELVVAINSKKLSIAGVEGPPL